MQGGRISNLIHCAIVDICYSKNFLQYSVTLTGVTLSDESFQPQYDGLKGNTNSH